EELAALLGELDTARAGELEAELGDVLTVPDADDLADGGLGAGAGAGEGAQRGTQVQEVPDHAVGDVLAQLVEDQGVLPRAGLVDQPEDLLGGVAEGGAAAHGHALVGQRGAGDLPAVVDLPHLELVRDEEVLERDL